MINIIFPIIITFASYFAGNFCIQCRPRLLKYKNNIFSCIAGMLISYIILIIIPNVYSIAMSAFYVLIGFTFFLVLHAKLDTTHLKKTHVYFSLTYHVLLGIVLVKMTEDSFYDGLLLFIPILFMTTLTKLSAHQVHHLGPYTNNKSKWSYILAAGPLIGVIIVILFPISKIILTVLNGIVGGIILFIVIKELLPTPRSLNILWFLIGEAMFLVLVFF